MAELAGGGPLFDDELLVWKRFNATAAHHDTRDFHDVLTDVADRYADCLAVVAPDGALTYHGLRRRAQDSLRALACLGVRPGDRVGLLADRRIGSYVLIYATTLMGASYVPVDARSTTQTVALLRRAGIRVLVGSVENLAPYTEVPDLVCRTPQDLCTIGAGLAVDHLPRAFDDKALLYVIHTSGTTGVPKGVCVPRRGMLNLARWYIGRHDVVPGDRLSQNAPLTFDPSAQQMFSAWLSGASLLVMPDDVRTDPYQMIPWLADNQITHLDMVTAHWTHLCAALDGSGRNLPCLQWAIVAGETMHFAQCEQWFRALGPDCQLHNIYGPTETTVNATQFEVRSEESVALSARTPTVPIGTPLPGYRVYLVDDRDELCPPGLVGEIVVAGDGVATGYLNDPVRTAQRFVEVHLQGQLPERVYRTGDLAELVDFGAGRWVLQFRGRRDRQIKVSGYRVELDAVELVARGCPGVEQVAVLPWGNPVERLACVYTGTAGPDDVHAHLGSLLPGYVVIADIVHLTRLPVTASGKVDQDALRAALDTRHGHGGDQLLRSRVEQIISEVWAAQLGRPDIPADARFFTLGGSSLAAFRVVVQLKERGVDVRGTDLLGDPTVGECAALAGSRARTAAAAVDSHHRLEWTDDRERMRSRLNEVWRWRARPAAGIAPAGPLTRAWLANPRTPTATACVELEFDARFAPDAVATALQRTIDTHAALRTRWRPTDTPGGVRVETMSAAMPIPVVAVPSASAPLGLLRDLVAEAAAFGDGESRAAVAVTDGGTTHLILFLPHVLVDGTALSVVTEELIDRVHGVTPTAPPDVLATLDDWYARLAEDHARHVTATEAIWTQFRRADSALTRSAASRRATSTARTFTIRMPDLPEGTETAWMCAVAASAVGDVFAVPRVPVSVLRPPPAGGPSRTAALVANMLDAVPLRVGHRTGPAGQMAEAVDALEAATGVVTHWTGLAVSSDPNVGCLWADSELPLIGRVRVQRVAGAMSVPDGVRWRLPGPAPRGNNPWIELAERIADQVVDVTLGNFDDATVDVLRLRLLRAAAGVAPPPGDGRAGTHRPSQIWG